MARTRSTTDECVNTHHFVPILDRKNTENDQIYQIILQISLVCVFVYFRYKRMENKAKVSKMEFGWETEQNGALPDRLDTK